MAKLTRRRIRGRTSADAMCQGVGGREIPRPPPLEDNCCAPRPPAFRARQPPPRDACAPRPICTPPGLTVTSETQFALNCAWTTASCHASVASAPAWRERQDGMLLLQVLICNPTAHLHVPPRKNTHVHPLRTLRVQVAGRVRGQAPRDVAQTHVWKRRASGASLRGVLTPARGIVAGRRALCKRSLCNK